MLRINIGKVIRKVKKVFDFSQHFRRLPDQRRDFFLPVAAVLWLVMWQFLFRRTYSLLAIDEYLRRLTLAEVYTILSALMPGGVSEAALRRLKEKHRSGKPLISDSQISRVLCSIAPRPIEHLLLAMTLRCRRNKTWDYKQTRGRSVVAYDATGEGSSKDRKCRYCKPTSDGSGYYHLGVHLRQVGCEPEMTMGHRLVPRGKGEITVAKEIARQTIRKCRGKYADLVLGDGLYLDKEFFNIHTRIGMDVLARVQQKDMEKLPRDMNIFKDAQALFEMRKGPDEEFVDSRRRRSVRLWDEEDFGTWPGLKAPVRVLRMEVEDLKAGRCQTHWAATTLRKEAASARQVYEYTVTRWHIENKEFRQEKSFEGFEHRQVHHDRGTRVFMALYLIVMNVVRWLAFRALPSVSRRLRETRFGLIHFRQVLHESWAIWLYEWAKCAFGRSPPLSQRSRT